jgi:hypothetical protein
VTKAVTTAALTTYVAVFILTRLEGIPPHNPIIHALILLAGLTAVRIFTRFEAKRRLQSWLQYCHHILCSRDTSICLQA